MLEYYNSVGHTNWGSNVRNSLQINGFGYIWNIQNIENDIVSISEYLQRVTDQYKQTWLVNCSTNRKLSSCIHLNSGFGTESYILNIDVAKFG